MTVKEWYHNEYLQSESWKRHRDRILAQRERRCELCGAPANIIHHMSYADVCGNESTERDEDLLCVCGNCHSKIHGEWQKNADKYAERIDKVTDEMVDVARKAIIEALEPILMEEYAIFDQYAGSALAVILEHSKHKPNGSVFWKLRDQYKYFNLITMFKKKMYKLVPDTLGYGYSAIVVSSSIRLSALRKIRRKKMPNNMKEFRKESCKRMKKQIYEYTHNNDTRCADYEEEQPEDHKDRRPTEDRAERAVQEV